MEPVDGDQHWRLEVTRNLATPGDFLFGGCGLAAGLVALEAASGRPTIWATAQYLSYAPTGSVLDIDVIPAARGRHITQARAVARVGDREILTVNAALGTDDIGVAGTWVEPPAVPRPEDCPPRQLPPEFANTILDSVEVRVASERSPNLLDGTPGPPDSAVWARVPGQLEPSAATLAIFGDYVSGAATQPLGRRAIGRSLDNTLRVAQLAQTGWVLCDMRIHAIANGYAQGLAFMWSEGGMLLATASQSFAVRFFPS